LKGIHCIWFCTLLTISLDCYWSASDPGLLHPSLPKNVVVITLIVVVVVVCCVCGAGCNCSCVSSSSSSNCNFNVLYYVTYNNCNRIIIHFLIITVLAQQTVRPVTAKVQERKTNRQITNSKWKHTEKRKQ